jgi:hypothetical protein
MHYRLTATIVFGLAFSSCLSFSIIEKGTFHGYTLSQADMGAINRLVAHRRDVRKPIVQAMMLRADYAEMMSGRSDKTGDPVTIFRVRKKDEKWILEESSIQQTTVLTAP